MRLFRSSPSDASRLADPARGGTMFGQQSRLRCHWLLLAVVCWGMVTTATAIEADDQPLPLRQPAVIQLLSHAECPGERVRLADVADISMATPDLYLRLSQIDLAEIDDARPPQRIPRDQIELRLRLAGFKTHEIELVGARSVTVHGPQPMDLTDAAIEEAAVDAIGAQLGLGREDLRVTLTSPVAERWQTGRTLLSGTRLEVVPNGDNLLGRVSCTCRLMQGNRIIGSHVAIFQVTRRQEVLVSTASLSRGQRLTRNVIREEVRYVTSPIDELSREQIENKSLKLAVVPGEIITLRHIAQDSLDEGPAVIRVRDAVRVTATKGPLQVVIRDAEAMQAGRTGQLIRVRNVQSNRIITGRVSGPGEVQIDLP